MCGYVGDFIMKTQHDTALMWDEHCYKTGGWRPIGRGRDEHICILTRPEDNIALHTVKNTGRL